VCSSTPHTLATAGAIDELWERVYAVLNITPPDVVRVMPHRVLEPLLDESWVSLRLEPGEALNTMFDASVQRKGQRYSFSDVWAAMCFV
jgi:hypothetical protein